MVLGGDPTYASDVTPTLEPAMCHLVQQTAQTGWTSNTLTAVTFGTGSEVVDTDLIHSETLNPSYLLIGRRLGVWKVCGTYAAANNSATTIIRAALFKNGTVINGSFSGDQLSTTSSFYTATTPTILVRATSATDRIELYGHQTAGSGTIGTAINSSMVASSIIATWERS